MNSNLSIATTSASDANSGLSIKGGGLFTEVRSIVETLLYNYSRGRSPEGEALCKL